MNISPNELQPSQELFVPNLRDRRGLRETRVSRYQLRVSTRARTGGGWLSRRVSQTGLLTSM